MLLGIPRLVARKSVWVGLEHFRKSISRVEAGDHTNVCPAGSAGIFAEDITATHVSRLPVQRDLWRVKRHDSARTHDPALHFQLRPIADPAVAIHPRRIFLVEIAV